LQGTGSGRIGRRIDHALQFLDVVDFEHVELNAFTASEEATEERSGLLIRIIFLPESHYDGQRKSRERVGQEFEDLQGRWVAAMHVVEEKGERVLLGHRRNEIGDLREQGGQGVGRRPGAELGLQAFFERPCLSSELEGVGGWSGAADLDQQAAPEDQGEGFRAARLAQHVTLDAATASTEDLVEDSRLAGRGRGENDQEPYLNAVFQRLRFRCALLKRHVATADRECRLSGD
jgi:hypothetical protein